ncbi:MAG: hypothetical protein HYV07_14745 [Deltaproteobacteria bacterium]|nr:hypothetical protein [Deltaproteobacteria bacterium]
MSPLAGLLGTLAAAVSIQAERVPCPIGPLILLAVERDAPELRRIKEDKTYVVEPGAEGLIARLLGPTGAVELERTIPWSPDRCRVAAEELAFVLVRSLRAVAIEPLSEIALTGPSTTALGLDLGVSIELASAPRGAIRVGAFFRHRALWVRAGTSLSLARGFDVVANGVSLGEVSTRALGADLRFGACVELLGLTCLEGIGGLEWIDASASGPGLFRTKDHSSIEPSLGAGLLSAQPISGASSLLFGVALTARLSPPAFAIEDADVSGSIAAVAAVATVGLGARLR